MQITNWILYEKPGLLDFVTVIEAGRHWNTFVQTVMENDL